MKIYFKTLAGFFIIPVLFWNSVYAAEKNDDIAQAGENALRWLKNQKVPNRTVPDPQPERRNLLLSYDIPESSPVYKYLFGRSVIYDDALAVIAFTMAKDYRTASLVLQALKRLQRKDGGIWFGCNVNNDWPSEDDYSESTDRTGATAWVGYAAVYYLRQQMKNKDDSGRFMPGAEAQGFLNMAKSIADYLISMQVRAGNDLRYGLITGGRNSFELKLEKNSVNEIFKEGNIDWISAEHNIDSYYFLRDLGILTGDGKYLRAADSIKSGLLKIWSKNDKQYYRGIRPGFVDSVLALDCASWGAMFSISAGRSDYARESLEIIEQKYSSFFKTRKGLNVTGYKPYAVKDIYEEADKKISQFYFPKDKSTWKDQNGVWVEGSLGVAMAYLKLGGREKAKSIIEQMIKLQNDKGGFIYFTKEIPHEFSTYPSIASTAWFIIVAKSYMDSDILNEFWEK